MRHGATCAFKNQCTCEMSFNTIWSSLAVFNFIKLPAHYLLFVDIANCDCCLYQRPPNFFLYTSELTVFMYSLTHFNQFILRMSFKGDQVADLIFLTWLRLNVLSLSIPSYCSTPKDFIAWQRQIFITFSLIQHTVQWNKSSNYQMYRKDVQDL